MKYLPLIERLFQLHFYLKVVFRLQNLGNYIFAKAKGQVKGLLIDLLNPILLCLDKFQFNHANLHKEEMLVNHHLIENKAT